jgi:3-isopropylmalate/(R)-2-methylmalate dehydratase small subunit
MIWKFPDNINTDFISPARFNLISSLEGDSRELAKIAFIEYRPEFAKGVKEGDIIAAGWNFGCGSSRESAAMALKACGLRAVLAKSFARIFYRNAMNAGLRCINVDTDGIDESDEIELDIPGSRVINRTKGTELPFATDPVSKRIIDEGGIISYLRKNGLDSLEGLLQ